MTRRLMPLARMPDVWPLDFWDVAMEQLVFWRRAGVCPRDCLTMLGWQWQGNRPPWDVVLHALLIETARMQCLRVGPHRRAA